MIPDSQNPGSLVGTRIGNYEVRGLLGAGGMGEVFLGEHPSIGRKVAIKVLRRELSSHGEVQRRFMAEAQAVNRIQHPNIIQIFDCGALPDGRLYLTMEHLKGEELGEIIEDRAPLSLQETLAFLRQIAGALDAAHAAGIVHRDLKPDNIFVCPSASGPLVKVLDFGIAKVREPGPGGQSQTATGTIMGTPLYMSPEQAAGATGKICPQSDIYALGVIVYQMLSGCYPIGAPSLALILAMHITDPPVPLSRVVEGLPPGVHKVIERSLEKNPEKRQQSARQFYEELQAACQDSPPSTRATIIGRPHPPLDENQLAMPAQPPHAAEKAPAAQHGVPVPVHIPGPIPAPNHIPAPVPVPNHIPAPVPVPNHIPGRAMAVKEPPGSTLAAQADLAAIRRAGRRVPMALGLGALVLVALVTTWIIASRRRDDPPRPPAAPGEGATGALGDGRGQSSEVSPSRAASGHAARPGHYLVHVKASRPGVKVETLVDGQLLHVKAPPFQEDVAEGRRITLKASLKGLPDQVESFPVTRDREVSFFTEPGTSSARPGTTGWPDRTRPAGAMERQGTRGAPIATGRPSDASRPTSAPDARRASPPQDDRPRPRARFGEGTVPIDF